MSEAEHLPNAPIKEAVIDIRIDLGSVTIDQLESLVHELPITDGEIKPIFSHQFKMDLGTENPEAVHNGGLIGYRIEYAKGGFIAQFQLTGFTLSKLPPYENWNSFKNEAMKLWPLFRETLSEYNVSRLAVRYINEVSLPLIDGKVDFDQYLVNGPRLPGSMGDEVNSFFSNVVIPFRDLKVKAVVVQALEPLDINRASVILDFDISREDVTGFSDSEMWAFFDNLRDIKNTAFRGSIKEPTLELYR